MELVEDATTEAFLGSLRRFVAIYQAPAVIWSDNAGNFVGAAKEMERLRALMKDKRHWDTVFEWVRVKGFTWKFIPPRSPHFGGLWESKVKLAKHYFHRAIKDRKLTYPHMLTFLYEVCSILNNRPITPLSLHPQDGQPLTPRHFLSGGPLTDMLQGKKINNPLRNHLDRWNDVTAAKQHFWMRYSKELLPEYQRRSKWRVEGRLPEVGDTVMMVDEDSPSRRWKVATIKELVYGRDG